MRYEAEPNRAKFKGSPVLDETLPRGVEKAIDYRNNVHPKGGGSPKDKGPHWNEKGKRRKERQERRAVRRSREESVEARPDHQLNLHTAGAEQSAESLSLPMTESVRPLVDKVRGNIQAVIDSPPARFGRGLFNRLREVGKLLPQRSTEVASNEEERITTEVVIPSSEQLRPTATDKPKRGLLQRGLQTTRNRFNTVQSSIGRVRSRVETAGRELTQRGRETVGGINLTKPLSVPHIEIGKLTAVTRRNLEWMMDRRRLTQLVGTNASSMAVRQLVREGITSVVSVSGAVGFVGGAVSEYIMPGQDHTIILALATRLIVGGMTSVIVEYGRQVDRNLEAKVRKENPELRGRKNMWLAKIKQLPKEHYVSPKLVADFLVPSNPRALVKAMFIGMGMSYLGGEAMSFVSDHSEEIKSFAGQVSKPVIEAVVPIANSAKDSLPYILNWAFSPFNKDAITAASKGVVKSAKEVKLPPIQGYVPKTELDALNKTLQEQMIVAQSAGEQIKNLAAENARLHDQVQALQEQLAVAGSGIAAVSQTAVSEQNIFVGGTTTRIAEEAAQRHLDAASSVVYHVRPGDSVEGVARKIGESKGISEHDLGKIYKIAQWIAGHNNISDSFLETTGLISSTAIPVDMPWEVFGAEKLADELAAAA